jgi:hypothetical protein
MSGNNRDSYWSSQGRPLRWPVQRRALMALAAGVSIMLAGCASGGGAATEDAQSVSAAPSSTLPAAPSMAPDRSSDPQATTTPTTPGPATTAESAPSPEESAGPEPTTVERTPAAERDCTPGYDPCLPPASDYDCRGGSGNGPAYTGRVAVDPALGDPYDLDRDGDGIGCE